MIRLNQVSKRYTNSADALKQINIEIAKGEMSFLTGHSGAGKSTILKLIAGIERTKQGQVLVDGTNVNKLNRHKLPLLRRNMGIVLQNPHLLNDRDIFANVALPLIIMGIKSQDITRRVRGALNKVGLLGKERMSPAALSTGEQQRVGIARAIVHKPTLLLADEPTGNLDPKLSRDIMQLFTEFNQVGVTVLVATHDIGLISKLPYRIIALEQGRIVADGYNN